LKSEFTHKDQKEKVVYPDKEDNDVLFFDYVFEFDDGTTHKIEMRLDPATLQLSNTCLKET